MFHSIRWRLVASYVLLTLLSVTIVGVLASEIVRNITQGQEVKELRANAHTLAQQLLPLMWTNASRQQIDSLTRAASILGDVRVRVLDRQEQVLADSGLPGPSEELVLIYPSEGAERFASQNEVWFNLIMPVIDETFHLDEFGIDSRILESLPSDTRYQFVWRSSGPWGERFSFGVPRTKDESFSDPSRPELDEPSRSANVIREPIGEANQALGYVELSANQDFSSAALATTRQAFLFAGAGATLLAIIVGLVMSQRLTKPLHTLQEASSQMGSGDLSVRAPVQGRDEIADLAAQFNQMAEQLQTSFTQLQNERNALQRFITDASHELRTPVTALKNFLTLIQGPAADDPQTRGEFLSESQLQVERLEWISNNLLDLSRLDAGLVELEFADNDVDELLQAAVNPFKTQAMQAQISLNIVHPGENLSLRCDAPRLEMALSNLLDNALKFTSPGGEVEIGARKTTQIIQLWVRDSGIGIHPEELPHIFERFYRGRTHKAPGSGLGLAIAKSLIEAQGGRLSVESEPGEGMKFVLDFPSTE